MRKAIIRRLPQLSTSVNKNFKEIGTELSSSAAKITQGYKGKVHEQFDYIRARLRS